MKNKKIQIAVVVVVGLVLIIAYKYPRLNTETKKVSYALGQQIGINFKNQKIDYDPEILALALHDVLKNNPSRMSVEEIQKALTDMQQAKVKNQLASSEKAMLDAREFLEKNKTKSGVQVTASGLQYIVEEEGKGKTLTGNDIVKAHYVGKLSTGETFDSTYERNQPSEFRINTLVRGWSEGMQLMRKGSKMKFFIPPELGYGNINRPRIPAYSVLVVEVEVF